MSRRRLVVFDVDGTLIDSEATIVAAMSQAFAAVGAAPPPRADVLSIVGLSLPLAVGRLAPGAGAAEVAEIVAAYREAFHAVIAAGMPPLYPGALAVLEALAAQEGVLLGIATGKSRRGLLPMLDGHGIGGMFVTVQVSDDHPSKPHPAMLQAALAAAGVGPRDAVMIGDTSFDMEMARAAGVPALGVTWGFHPAGALAAADALVHDRPQILPAIERLWGAA